MDHFILVKVDKSSKQAAAHRSDVFFGQKLAVSVGSFTMDLSSSVNEDLENAEFLT